MVSGNVAVILSAAKNLKLPRDKILRWAQNDKQ
jgi:hypothetical protein